MDDNKLRDEQNDEYELVYENMKLQEDNNSDIPEKQEVLSEANIESIEIDENQKTEANIRTITYENNKQNKKINSLSIIALAFVFSIIGGIIGSFLTYVGLNYSNKININNSNSLPPQEININLNDEIYYATAVAKKSRKWVVGVTTVETHNTLIGQETAQGVGSGVIVNENGYILTNSHVVGDGNADEIKVSLIDGSVEPAQILWNDSVLDLAIIKIGRKNLSYAEFGNSDELLVGEPVIAIGNPMSLDLDRTVTNGIISGLNRSLLIENTIIKPLIQTNASINPGNSGGPLLNAKGEVIGINTAKMTSTEGLGFSIPINIALPILEQIVNSGSAGGYMGIKYVSLLEYEQRMDVDITADYGIMIIGMVENSPGQKAGIKIGDIIIDIDGTKILEQTDLIRKLYEYKSGDVIKITYLRNNEKHTVKLTLAEKPTT